VVDSKKAYRNITFPTRTIKRMAEMEHGRWNFERLRDGWRYASTKDTTAKLSPYLVSWKTLPPDVAEYDLEAVKSFPRVLAKGGYAIKELRSNRSGTN
jgi:hypothetical protein